MYGKRILYTATEQGRGTRLYVRDVSGGKARALTPEGYSLFHGTVSPDSKFTAVRGPDRRLYLYPVEGGEPTAIPGLAADDVPVRFSADGHSLFVHREGELPRKVYRFDLTTGRKELWKELMPADAAGLSGISRVVVTPDGRAYAYSYFRVLSYLQLVEGLK